MKPARYLPLELVRPLDELNTVKWAEDNIYISPRITSPNPGPWRRDTVAAMCAAGGPLESLDDPAVELVGICAGAQSGKTVTGYSWLAKELATDPSGALIVMSSAQVAQDKAREVWLPLWEDSPRLRNMIPENRKMHWTKRMQLINKAGVYWAGANSPGALASKSMRRIFGDELDKWPQSFGRGNKHSAAASASEAGAMELLLQRCKAYRQKGLAKILVTSTPTDDQGPIWRVYLAGDQRKLYVPCPICKVSHVMEWKQFRIDMDVAKRDPSAAVAGAHYECPHCKAKWGDGERFAAIDAGEWRATAVSSNPLSRTFWFPSWNSKLVNMSYLAAQWIGAQASRTALQDFLNGESAEAFVHYENCIKDSAFGALEGEYQERQRFCDIAPYSIEYKDVQSWVIGGVDVQKGYLVATFRTFMAGGDSGLMWHGTVSDFGALDKLSEELGADCIFIDQRYRKREVQEFCYDHKGYIPCEGVKTTARSVFTVQALDLDEGKRGAGNGRMIEMVAHDGDQIKDILATMIDRNPNARRWLLPRGYGFKSDYTKQMSAERCVNGKWINPGERPNHAWDSECLCIVGALRLGIMQVGIKVESES
jgi:phage terminase large subunit GpA-like protein